MKGYLNDVFVNVVFFKNDSEVSDSFHVTLNNTFLLICLLLVVLLNFGINNMSSISFLAIGVLENILQRDVNATNFYTKFCHGFWYVFLQLYHKMCTWRQITNICYREYNI